MSGAVPIFLFARSSGSDAIRLTVVDGGIRRHFMIDGMAFDINPEGTVPPEYARFTKQYADSVRTFQELHPDHQIDDLAENDWEIPE